MQGVTIVDHPLVQHKLTLIRDKTISTKSFRELLKEIGMLLCYEVTRDLPLSDVVVETPLAQMQSAKIAGKKLVFVPVLRAGVTFVDGMMDLVPTARVAHIGGRIFLQIAVRPWRAARNRSDAGGRDRQHGRRRRRPAEGAGREGDSAGLPDRGA